ncbi:MAG: ABC transporter permease [Nanoarchaeota archaeon]|nr:ABC transporter permease [Nanoarchaeota archaeon]
MGKLITIVGKNIKVVSRSWMYVALLIFLPTFLVLATSLLLDSVNSKNVKIGLVDGPNSDKISELIPDGKFERYGTFEQCENNLKSHKIPVCINPIEDLNGTTVNIYFDNSKLLISQYAKQYVSKKIVEEQLVVFELTLDEILSKMDTLSSDVELAKNELEKSYQELIAQEETISTYQKNFSRTEQNFQQVYTDVKHYQPLIEENIKTLKEVKKYLGDNLTEFNQQSQSLRNQINLIKPILQNILPPNNYSEISNRLDSVTSTLNMIERDLNELNTKLYYDNPDLMLTDFNNAVATLDETKILFENLNKEIEHGITLIEENKNRAQNILNDIESNKEELEKIRGEVRSTSNYKIVLNDAFEINETASYLFFPLLLILIIAFTSIILSNILVVEQTHRQSYVREIITPTKDSTFLLGDFIVSLSIVLIQVLILFVLGEIMFGLSIFSNFPYLFFVAILVSSVFVLIGMSIGYLVRSKNISILISTFTLLFLIIFSDLLIPRQLAGSFIRIITSINPFVIADKLFFNVMIFSEAAQYAILYIVLLAVFAIMAFFFAYLSKKIGKYKIMQE